MTGDTIVAQCTPSGNGAIALLRVSGPEARTVIERCSQFSHGNVLAALSHTIHHGFITASDATILDEVLFLIMDGPRTFTGYNTIEITTHNNPFIIDSIITRIIACGARLAHNGEFSRQAVENGKMDLVKAEAINELIHAHSQEALKRSLEQLQGSFSFWIAELEKQLVTILALCEASFEFLEEDMDFRQDILDLLTQAIATIDSVTQTYDHQKIIKDGVRIALIGSVNAGKSSLFNTLLKKDRAIVTPIAGTTRDTIEGSMYHNGIYWTLIDTAGLRQTEDVIEQYGIKKSYEEAEVADIILLVCDGSRTMTEQECLLYNDLYNKHAYKVIKIINKQDNGYIEHNFYTNALHISTKTHHNIFALERLLQEKIQDLITKNTSPFLINKRHAILLTTCKQHLLIIQDLLNANPAYELIAYHLQDALTQLTELTGKTITNKMFDTIFSTFCVGK